VTEVHLLELPDDIGTDVAEVSDSPLDFERTGDLIES
jgi:hypothetical protein